MTPALDFEADTFLGLSPSERSLLCRSLAQRAYKLAEGCEPKYRAYYESIAKQWIALADDMERGT